MVKWADCWLSLSDKNNIKMKLWAKRVDNDFVFWFKPYYNILLGPNTRVFQIHHSLRNKFTLLHRVRMKHPKLITFYPSMEDTVSPSEGMWMF